MISRLVRRVFWEPFERYCRRTPLWPLQVDLTEPVPGVTCIRIGNTVTRSLSTLAGGYDYSVSYVIHGTVMIDTGFPWASQEMTRLIRAQGWDKTLTTVLNSHYHEDHIGNNDVLATLTKARLYGSAVTAAEVRMPRRLHWYRRFLFGPAPTVIVETAPARLTVGGLELLCLETPGHCPGHLCFYVPAEGWLFSGDLFVAPDLDTQLPDVDGPDWVSSLRKALALNATALFDAHGRVFLGADAVREALQAKLDFLVAVETRVRENLDSSLDLEQLSQRVFPPKNLGERLSNDGWLSVLTGSDFSRQHLVGSFAKRLLLKGNKPTASGDSE